MQPVRFTRLQRLELAQLGLPAIAIDCIETDALPRAREWLKVRPRRADVRDELRNVGVALEAAHDAIQRLVGASEQTPALLEARSLLPMGGRSDRMAGRRLAELAKDLAAGGRLFHEAIDGLPPGPLRHQTASPRPIKMIHSALQFGLIQAGADPQPRRLRPSTSPTSAFRRIVGICYASMGSVAADPERALRDYVKQWHELDKRLHPAAPSTGRP